MNKEQIVAMTKGMIASKKAMIALASSTSLAVGALGGFVTAMKKLEAKYELKYSEISDREIAEAKAFYSRHYKSEQFATVEGTVEALKENGSSIELDQAAMALLTYQGVGIAEDLSETEKSQMVEVARNVFTDANPIKDFDYEAELIRRDPDRAYVISKEEFNQTEFDYDQVEYTFYEGDGVLTNDRDQVLEDQEGLVGVENMTRFGYGSEDQNVVYIRNVRLGLDCTVIRSTGEYAKEVLGFIEHSHKPRVMKFRGDDD